MAGSSYLAVIRRRDENVAKFGTLFRLGNQRVEMVNGAREWKDGDAFVDAEQRVPTQYLHVPILEVEGAVGNYGCRVDGRFVIGKI